MKLVYTAGPYSAPNEYGRKQNCLRAEAVAVELWKAGYAVICPHKNSEQLDGPITWDQFMAGDLEMVRRSDAVVMLPGWEDSTGARMEWDFAIDQGIPVYYWPDPAILHGIDDPSKVRVSGYTRRKPRRGETITFAPYDPSRPIEHNV